ncbi:MAG: hypothetical protein V3U73_14890, partial [bacterium]
MIYLFLISAAIYLVLVAACDANQKKDVCFIGHRTLIGALALIAFLDLVAEWKVSSSAATAKFDVSVEEVISIPSAEAGLPTPDTEDIAAVDKTSSEHRLKSRADKFLAQGERGSILKQASSKQRVRRF